MYPLKPTIELLPENATTEGWTDPSSGVEFTPRGTCPTVEFVNGMQFLSFDGGQSLVSNASVLWPETATLLIVSRCRVLATEIQQWIVHGMTVLRARSDKGVFHGGLFLEDHSAQFEAAGPMHDALVVHSIRYDGESLEYRQNNDLVDSVQCSGPRKTSGEWVIGGHPALHHDSGLYGLIGDIVMYSRALGDQDLREVTDTAMSRYGIRDVERHTLFSGDFFGSDIEVVGDLAYLAYVDGPTDNVAYAVAPVGSLDWQVQSAKILAPEHDSRGVSLRFFDGWWYLYYDDAQTGEIHLAKSQGDLSSLQDVGVVLTGVGLDWEQYVRHPSVLTPAQSADGQWHMVFDGRAVTPHSEFGDIGHAVSSDGVNWTRTSGPIIERSGISDSMRDSVNAPSVMYANGKYRVAFSSYNKRFRDKFYPDAWPHWIHTYSGPSLTQLAPERIGPALSPAQGGVADIYSVGSPTWHSALVGEMIYHGSAPGTNRVAVAMD